MNIRRRSFCIGAAASLISPAITGCASAIDATLPGTRFFVFGEGDRRKLLYRRGVVSDVKTGEIVWRRAITRETVLASETAVDVIAGGVPVRIREDDRGVWIGNELVATGTAIKRPRFGGSRHAGLLRALHHELLVNVVDGVPVPNLFVYRKAWRRDAAMMAMCLAKTGNLHLIRRWTLDLDTVFDGNAGVHEPDNIGQTMYLLALADAPRDHPMIERSLAEARRFRTGDFISGPTDGSVHAAYQTLWLKFGLNALGLEDDYRTPWQPDHYRSLVWWMPRGGFQFPARFRARTGGDYPYLAWAEAHYWQSEPPAMGDPDRFPLTWERNAAAADYERMRAVGDDWVGARVTGPHGWHAAEAFLYLEKQA